MEYEIQQVVKIFFVMSLLSSFRIQDCTGLRDIKIEVPKYARVGSTVRLRCEMDMEGDALYAVKWYKGAQEFYRFVPKEVPPEKVFPIPGLTVDVRNSTIHDVVLGKVSLDLTGTFKCVVSAESPFQTLSASADLIALIIGDDRPSLRLDLSHPSTEFHPGDNVTAICVSPPSYPPSNITWYLNGNKVSDSPSVTIPNTWLRISSRYFTVENPYSSIEKSRYSDPRVHTQVTESMISFELPQSQISRSSSVHLRCQATVFSAYDSSSYLSVISSPRRFSNPDTLLKSSGVTFNHFYWSSSSLGSITLWILAILLINILHNGFLTHFR